jgi:cytochrome c-type biogenesis protein CcmH/NrfG
MVLRQETTLSQEQKIKNVQQGIKYAKEAISLDPSDGTSWGILGNAYLSSFFTIVQNPSTLRLCMSAYKQAVSPDLFSLLLLHIMLFI